MRVALGAGVLRLSYAGSVEADVEGHTVSVADFPLLRSGISNVKGQVSNVGSVLRPQDRAFVGVEVLNGHAGAFGNTEHWFFSQLARDAGDLGEEIVNAAQE